MDKELSSSESNVQPLETEFKIKVTPWNRWRGDYGWDYSNDSDNEYELVADSVEALYEEIAKNYNRWLLKTESLCRLEHGDMANYGIEYSPIYIEVEEYSEEKRNATKAYKELGALRDKALAEEREKKEKERIRHEKRQREEQERKDRAEYERLRKKFEN